MSDDGLAAVVSEIRQMRGDLTARIDAFAGDLARVRVDLMGRMDRLQDSLTEQRDDLSVLLDLLVTNQRLAERGISESKHMMDGLGSASSAITTLERQVRRLQDEVRQIKDKG